MKKYLGDSSFDPEKMKGMNGVELLAYAQSLPQLPFGDEYSQALSIRLHNLKPGKLTGYDCPICRNKGHLLDIADDGTLVMRQCECIKTRSIRAKADQSNLGNLLKKRFANFQTDEEWQKSMVQKAKGFLQDEEKNWFAVFGQTGCGKTHLCSAVANQLLARGKQVVYMLWTTEIRQLKRQATDPQYDQKFNQFRKAEVLYIDDLFKGKVTEADVQTCYDLLNYRYNNPQFTTLISSELSLSQIAEIDEAIAGRIRERCGNHFVTVSPDPAKNWRLKDI